MNKAYLNKEVIDENTGIVSNAHQVERCSLNLVNNQIAIQFKSYPNEGRCIENAPSVVGQKVVVDLTQCTSFPSAWEEFVTKIIAGDDAVIGNNPFAGATLVDPNA